MGAGGCVELGEPEKTEIQAAMVEDAECMVVLDSGE